MYGASSLILARCGGGGSSTIISNGCRGVSSRSSSSSSTTRRSRSNNGVLAATTSAGVACTMCHSLRMTAACSASTSLHLRHGCSGSGSSINAAARSSLVTRSSSTYTNNGQPHFGNGMSPAAASTCSNGISSDCNNILPRVSLNNNRTIHSSSYGLNTNNSIISSTLLPSNTFGGIMGSYLGSSVASSTAFSSQEALLDPSTSIASDGWTMKELAGAILFATAATAGSMLLGPIDRLRGRTTGGNGSGGSNNGGGGGSNNGGGGPVGGGEQYDHSLDSHVKEEEDEKKELGLGIATVPRPYEVCTVHSFDQ